MTKMVPLKPYETEACARLLAIWQRKSKALNLTQQSIAADLGKHPSAIGHWLYGRNALGFEALFQFANKLQVHPYQIDPTIRERWPANLVRALDIMQAESEPEVLTAHIVPYPAIQKPQPMLAHESRPAPRKAATKKKRTG